MKFYWIIGHVQCMCPSSLLIWFCNAMILAWSFGWEYANPFFETVTYTRCINMCLYVECCVIIIWQLSCDMTQPTETNDDGIKASIFGQIEFNSNNVFLYTNILHLYMNIRTKHLAKPQNENNRRKKISYSKI